MLHPLITQLHFARSEFQRCLSGVTANEALIRVQHMNCLSWMVGHLANQEQRLWLQLGQGKMIAPELNDLVGYGKPASTPRGMKCGPYGKMLPPPLMYTLNH